MKLQPFPSLSRKNLHRAHHRAHLRQAVDRPRPLIADDLGDAEVEHLGALAPRRLGVGDYDDIIWLTVIPEGDAARICAHLVGQVCVQIRESKQFSTAILVCSCRRAIGLCGPSAEYHALEAPCPSLSFLSSSAISSLCVVVTALAMEEVSMPRSKAAPRVKGPYPERGGSRGGTLDHVSSAEAPLLRPGGGLVGGALGSPPPLLTLDYQIR